MSETTERLYLFAPGADRAPSGFDVGGTLYGPTGETLWSHMSSSLGWLRADLTSNFGRRGTLELSYVGGYEVIEVFGEGPAYDELCALWDAIDPNWRTVKAADA